MMMYFFIDFFILIASKGAGVFEYLIFITPLSKWALRSPNMLDDAPTLITSRVHTAQGRGEN
jgi:hypothetical protein